MSGAIFISYRRDDTNDFVARLEATLVGEFGRERVFRDKTRLTGSQDWPKDLEAAANSCQCMLVVIGERWTSLHFEEGPLKNHLRLSDPDDWVRKEIGFALKAGRRIYPICHNAAKVPPKAWLANVDLGDLAEKNQFTVRTDDYEADYERLACVLRIEIPSRDPKPSAEIDSTHPPVSAINAGASQDIRVRLSDGARSGTVHPRQLPLRSATAAPSQSAGPDHTAGDTPSEQGGQRLVVAEPLPATEAEAASPAAIEEIRPPEPPIRVQATRSVVLGILVITCVWCMATNCGHLSAIVAALGAIGTAAIIPSRFRLRLTRTPT